MWAFGTLLPGMYETWLDWGVTNAKKASVITLLPLASTAVPLPSHCPCLLRSLAWHCFSLTGRTVQPASLQTLATAHPGIKLSCQHKQPTKLPTTALSNAGRKLVGLKARGLLPDCHIQQLILPTMVPSSYETASKSQLVLDFKTARLMLSK